MKRLLRAKGAMVILSGALACSGGFARPASGDSLDVTMTGGNPGNATAAGRIALSFTSPSRFELSIVAHHADGSVNTSFSGYVRLSVKPGTVTDVSGPNVLGRNVRLIDGKADQVTVGLLAAYGDTRIWAEDLGYIPVDPNSKPPPQCADGIDNNGNGLIDYPADPGCAFANDDSEDGGTLATGISPILYFKYPLVSDVRGRDHGGTGTSFPHEQVQIDTGFHPGDSTGTPFARSVVVTRISADGFYVTDIDDSALGFNSLFAYNFSAPPNLGVCDRLTSLSGTASDFYGFTELNFPTWTAEAYDPRARHCLVPEPFVFDVAGAQSTHTKLRETASLVRVWTGNVTPADGSAAHPHTLHVASHFGSGYPKAPAYAPTADASNCDLNGDGSVNFNMDPEKSCGIACENDLECAEWSAYAARGDFVVVLHDEITNGNGALEANGSSAAAFDAPSLRGKPLKSFTGTLRYFSGGQQFTIEARCADDIVVDLNAQPSSSERACVTRTSTDNPGN